MKHVLFCADIQKPCLFYCYFSCLNDVSVRESNVIQPSRKESVLIRSFIHLAGKRKFEFEFENYVCAIYGCKPYLLENTAYLPYFVKIFIFNPDENIYSVY